MGLYSGDVIVYCDNQSNIYLVKNHVFHDRSKYIDVCLHFVKDAISSGEIKLGKIITEKNLANMFTKVLPAAKF